MANQKIRIKLKAYEHNLIDQSFDIHNPNPRTVDAMMKLDLPAGVEIEIKLNN